MEDAKFSCFDDLANNEFITNDLKIAKIATNRLKNNNDLSRDLIKSAGMKTHLSEAVCIDYFEKSNIEDSIDLIPLF